MELLLTGRRIDAQEMKQWGLVNEIVPADRLMERARELAQKMQAVFHHKSQRSQTPVASGLREPWQQAEQQNRALAETYDGLGLADYEAIEGFAKIHLA